MDRMNELGFYTLAGAPDTPRDLIKEIRQGEEMGLGSVFIPERFNIKEAATLSGAVGAVSTDLGRATAATNHNTRLLPRRREEETAVVTAVLIVLGLKEAPARVGREV